VDLEVAMVIQVVIQVAELGDSTMDHLGLEEVDMEVEMVQLEEVDMEVELEHLEEVDMEVEMVQLVQLVQLEEPPEVLFVAVIDSIFVAVIDLAFAVLRLQMELLSD
jgi:hypothetical protein